MATENEHIVSLSIKNEDGTRTLHVCPLPTWFADLILKFMNRHRPEHYVQPNIKMPKAA
jgi:hypothetical protein